MKTLPALLIALHCVGAHATAAPPPAPAPAPSPGTPPRPTPVLPGKWRMVPEFSDEFQLPALDQAKWQPHNPEWPGRPPALYQEKNVSVADGKLHLQLKAEKLVNPPQGYQDYSCAVVRSRARIRYGYFEIRAQAADSVGTSAFWFYHNEPARWVEIDVFELAPRHAKYGRTLFTNAPVIRFPGQTGELTNKDEFPLRDDPSAAFHTWGLLWDADLITWYLDGKPLRSLANTHWKNPLRLILDTETHPDWMGLPDPAKPPAVFIVDYVRTWQNDPT